MEPLFSVLAYRSSAAATVQFPDRSQHLSCSDDLGETEAMAELRAEHRKLTRQAQRSKSRAQELYERTALYNKISIEFPNAQRRQEAEM